jgi:cytochrome c-type biogenesis protein CcmH/NrfG
MKSGDSKLAEKSYARALRLDPQNKNAKDMLRKIRELRSK